MDKTKESHLVFHSFCLHPKINFDGQNDVEKVILTLRAHPFTQIWWTINSFILLVVVILLNFILPSFLNLKQILIFDLFGLAITGSYFWFNFLGWYFNVGIITDERVVDIDFNSVLYKEVTIALLDKVEDVTSKAGGFFSSVFDYGNVFVQTAGTEANIEFMLVPKPSMVVEIINDLLKP